MKSYWVYACDHGHSWAIYREFDAAELPGDPICPAGHEAVTLSRQPVVDRVEITIRPAARIVDPVKGQVGHDNEYFLVLVDPRDGQQCVSQVALTWPEAIKAIQSIHDRGLTRERSWEYLERLRSKP